MVCGFRFLLIGGLLFLAGCGRDRDHAPLVSSGYIEATDVRVSTKVGGRLLDFPHQEGDALDRGALIAQLDTVDFIERHGNDVVIPKSYDFCRNTSAAPRARRMRPSGPPTGAWG